MKTSKEKWLRRENISHSLSHLIKNSAPLFPFHLNARAWLVRLCVLQSINRKKKRGTDTRLTAAVDHHRSQWRDSSPFTVYLLIVAHPVHRLLTCCISLSLFPTCHLTLRPSCVCFEICAPCFVIFLSIGKEVWLVVCCCFLVVACSQCIYFTNW